MPDPSIVAVGADASNTTTSAVTLVASQPSGLRNGDLLLVVLRQDYVHTTGGSNLRTPTDPTGYIAIANETAASIGVANTNRVSLSVWAVPRTGSGSVSVDIAAGGGTANVYEHLFIIGLRYASTFRNAIDQNAGLTASWPTSAQSMTVDADNSAAISIITNRSTDAQTLDTANGFTVAHSDTDRPAVAVAYRTVDTPSQAVPQWTGTGSWRAQTTFEVVWGPPGNAGIFVDGAVH